MSPTQPLASINEEPDELFKGAFGILEAQRVRLTHETDRLEAQQQTRLWGQYQNYVHAWQQRGWTRHHPVIPEIIRVDLPEGEDISQVPREEISLGWSKNIWFDTDLSTRASTMCGWQSPTQ